MKTKSQTRAISKTNRKQVRRGSCGKVGNRPPKELILAMRAYDNLYRQEERDIGATVRYLEALSANS